MSRVKENGAKLPGATEATQSQPGILLEARAKRKTSNSGWTVFVLVRVGRHEKAYTRALPKFPTTDDFTATVARAYEMDREASSWVFPDGFFK